MKRILFLLLTIVTLNLYGQVQYGGVVGVVSTVNSSTTTLAVSGVFTGTSEDVTNYVFIAVTVFSDVASATDGLSIQQSSNGTNWDITDVYTVPAATGKTYTFGRTAKFFRLVYTNGGTIQASFRLQTVFSKTGTKPSSVRPQDARTNDNDMEEVIGYSALYNGTTWDRMRGDITNGLDVDVTRLPALVTGSAVIGALIANQSVNVAQVNGVTPLMGNGVTGTGSQRVTIASDGTAISTAGYMSVKIDQTTLGTTNAVQIIPGTTGGSLVDSRTALTNTVVSAKASAGQLYGYYWYNPNSSAAYIQIFNTASGSVTLGTTTPVYVVTIPATSGANVEFTTGIAHSTAITYAATTTATGSTANASTLTGFMLYK